MNREKELGSCTSFEDDVLVELLLKLAVQFQVPRESLNFGEVREFVLGSPTLKFIPTKRFRAVNQILSSDSVHVPFDSLAVERYE
jgi:hypothetical protein